MDNPKRVGVREVAAAAEVSTQTVSRVINGATHVRPETRERVLAVMAEMGYRVNNAARALGTNVTRTLGLIVSDAALYGPASAIAAVEAAARAENHWLVTGYVDADDEASWGSVVEHLLSQGVDGLIVVAAHQGSVETLLAGAVGVPVVVMYDGEGAEAQRRGGEIAALHLAGLGHRRIGRLGGPADWVEETLRAEGFARAIVARGFTPAWNWRGDWSARSGFEAAAEIAQACTRPGGPTAIVAANDQMALGLISGLAHAGVEVPGVVSVVGFDDNPDAEFYRPALTTVRIDIAAEARRCVAVAIGHGDVAGPDAAQIVARASAVAAR